MTRPITMASSASFPAHTNMADVFKSTIQNKVKLINKIVINQVISYWRSYGSSICFIGRPRTRKWANTNNNITLLLDYHRRRKVKNIGRPRFRILGVGGQGGGQFSSRHMTSY